METLWQFTVADNSIDVIGLGFFFPALYFSLKYLYLNNINVQGKILYLFIALVSAMHIIQVVTQVHFNGPMWWTFRVWDIANYLTGVLMLMAAQRLYKRERHHIE